MNCGAPVLTWTARSIRAAKRCNARSARSPAASADRPGRPAVPSRWLGTFSTWRRTGVQKARVLGERRERGDLEVDH